MNKVLANGLRFLRFETYPLGSRYDAELAGRIALMSFMTVAEIERWVL